MKKTAGTISARGDSPRARAHSGTLSQNTERHPKASTNCLPVLWQTAPEDQGWPGRTNSACGGRKGCPLRLNALRSVQAARPARGRGGTPGRPLRAHLSLSGIHARRTGGRHPDAHLGRRRPRGAARVEQLDDSLNPRCRVRLTVRPGPAVRRTTPRLRNRRPRASPAPRGGAQ